MKKVHTEALRLHSGVLYNVLLGDIFFANAETVLDNSKSLNIKCSSLSPLLLLFYLTVQKKRHGNESMEL